MGWVTDDGLHEGHLVAVLADGRDATAADNPHADNSAWRCFDGTDGRPRAVGVRAGCDCYDESLTEPVRTWRGAAVHPVHFGDDAKTEGDGAHGPYAEWRTAHVDPAAAATVPADVTALLDTVRTRLAGLAEQRPLAALTAVARLDATAEAAAVRAAGAAQRRGDSWTRIGAALGVSKQAAHQRLARHVAALAEEAAAVRAAAPGSEQAQLTEHLEEAEAGDRGAAGAQEQRRVEAEVHADRLGLLGAVEADETHHQGGQDDDRDRPRRVG